MNTGLKEHIGGVAAETCAATLFAFLMFWLGDKYGLPGWQAGGGSLAIVVLAFVAYQAAHVNPAVTASLTIGGGFSVREVPLYVAAQFLGFGVGTLLALWVETGSFALSGATRHTCRRARLSGARRTCWRWAVVFNQKLVIL